MPDNQTPANPAPAAEKEVRIYNRSSTRSFIHEYKGVKHVAPPASFTTVPAPVAERWMAMFEQDIAEAGVAQKEMAGVTAQLAEAQAEIAKLKAQIAAQSKDGSGKSKPQI